VISFKIISFVLENFNEKHKSVVFYSVTGNLTVSNAIQNKQLMPSLLRGGYSCLYCKVLSEPPVAN
jgi:hypothetical protein